jgi:hypothetical protein
MDSETICCFTRIVAGAARAPGSRRCPVAAGEPVVDAPATLAAPRLLCDPRDEFVAARTQAVWLYQLLAELSSPGASAVSCLPGRVTGVGWVVVVPLGPTFSPMVILADMQLKEGGVGEAEPA